MCALVIGGERVRRTGSKEISVPCQLDVASRHPMRRLREPKVVCISEVARQVDNPFDHCSFETWVGWIKFRFEGWS